MRGATSLQDGQQNRINMTNKEAFDIVLKLAKANTLAEHDIMYAQQEAQASLERQAIEIVEDYCNDLIRIFLKAIAP